MHVSLDPWYLLISSKGATGASQGSTALGRIIWIPCFAGALWSGNTGLALRDKLLGWYSALGDLGLMLEGMRPLATDKSLKTPGNQALRELKTPGKSGSVFYLSHDSRFMVKTMRKEEMQVLLAMLPKYYEHICSHPHTLLTKFYGLHRIKTKKKRNVSPGQLMRLALCHETV